MTRMNTEHISISVPEGLTELALKVSNVDELRDPSLKVKHDRAILDLEDLRFGPSFSVGDVRLPVIHENDGDDLRIGQDLKLKLGDSFNCRANHLSKFPNGRTNIVKVSVLQIFKALVEFVSRLVGSGQKLVRDIHDSSSPVGGSSNPHPTGEGPTTSSELEDEA